MNHFTFSALLASLFSFLASLSLFFLITSNVRIKRIMCLYWFSIGFWAFFVGTQSVTISFLSSFWWGWLLILGCTFIPVFFFHLSLVITKQENTTAKRMLIGSYWVTVAFNIFNLLTAFFTGEIVYRDMYAYPKPAFLFIFYFLLFDLLILWGTLLLLRYLRRLTTEKQKCLKLFLITHVLAYCGGMDNFLIMVDVRIPPLYPYGLYVIPFYALATIYVAYRLFGCEIPRTGEAAGLAN